VTRATWVDTPLAWVDYQEARVEALRAYATRLEGEVENLRRVVQDLRNAQVIQIFTTDDGPDLSRLLVPTLPVPELTQ